MAPAAAPGEIKLEDIDFEKVKECTNYRTVKTYIKLLEDDGAYFEDLLRACKNKLLELNPKEYYLLYPRVASEDEVAEAMHDILEWEMVVKETDASLKKSKEHKIWDEGSKVPAPIRGQEATVARPNLQQPPGVPQTINKKKEDAYARDKTAMKDYYSAWDKVDVDELEAELDEEEKRQEESRRKHFEELREQQEEANKASPIEVGNLPSGVPEAHRKHLADSEKEKGNEAFYAKDWAEAEAYYGRSLHFRTDDPSTWANRALVRLKLQNPSGALHDCDRALEANPRYMKALHRRGKALHELKRYEDAVRSFQLALAESPGNAQINGDLMVSRRHLREPPSAPSAPSRRRVNDPSTCRVEEVEDDEDDAPKVAPSAPAPGYTRVAIEEDSDSEEEEGAAAQAPAATSSASRSAGFTKVAIEEVSGSEDEEEPAAAPAAGGRRPGDAAAAAPAVASPTAAEAAPRRSPPADAPSAASVFQPPPRVPPAASGGARTGGAADAAASSVEAAAPACSFDDMD